MEMNGGSVIAMTGKNCVAIASDLRLGQQAVGLSADFEKVRFLSRPVLVLNLPSASSSKTEIWIEVKIKIRIELAHPYPYLHKHPTSTPIPKPRCSRSDR
jgi:hypothetical protein